MSSNVSGTPACDGAYVAFSATPPDVVVFNVAISDFETTDFFTGPEMTSASLANKGADGAGAETFLAPRVGLTLSPLDSAI